MRALRRAVKNAMYDKEGHDKELVFVSDRIKTFFPRQRHLPKDRCQDTRQAKTLRTRLRQDETRDII